MIGKDKVLNNDVSVVNKEVRHPAKYTDKFIPIFANHLKCCDRVLDPMGGTGKIGLIKKHGFDGVVYNNDLEVEWLQQSFNNGCDVVSNFDAANTGYPDGYFDGICTSPTYGNRMADSHVAKDLSVRNTYTHAIGRKLHDSNTGKMQWGESYRSKHVDIYKEIYRLLATNGIFILNVKDHIRKGDVVHVSDFHLDTALSVGLVLEDNIKVEAKGNRFGRNGVVRVGYENIFIFRKPKKTAVGTNDGEVK